MTNTLIMVALLALAGLFIFLAVRALRARRAWIKWPAFVLSGLLGLLFLAVTAVAGYGFYRLNNPPYQYPPVEASLPVTGGSLTHEQLLARGEKLAYLCGDCHSSSGSAVLDGSGEDFLADPAAPPVGSMWAPNITPGGVIKDYTDAQLARAIREGVDKDGKSMVIMPSYAFRNMSDEDVAAVIAYLRSQPAVERELPERQMNVLAAVLFGAGMFPMSPQAPVTEAITAPAPGTVEHGKYTIDIMGCADCHGAKMDGVGMFGPGVNLTQIVPDWTEEEFITFFRTSTDPKTGRAVTEMPVGSYDKALSDQELSDMWKFLHGMPRVESPSQ